MTDILKQLKDLDNEIDSLRDSLRPTQKKIYELSKKQDKIRDLAEKEVVNDPKNKEFIDKLNEADVEDLFIDLENDDSFVSVFEDDGTLHVVRGKIRGCFISNQDITKAEWNKQARPILKQLGFKWSDLNK